MLEKIREAEKASHIEIYSKAKLFESGSWLSKPVKTVTELFHFFEKNQNISVLDLGCGVGRNCIPAARYFDDCSIDCVDILHFAIEKIYEYSRQYGVFEKINGIVSSIDDFTIEKSKYDFIMAVSALEHVKNEEVFINKLNEIKEGTKENGIVCLIINSQVTEKNKETGEELTPQFEVNMKTEKMIEVLNTVFDGWEKIKTTVTTQKYDIPREQCVSELQTNVVTFVLKSDIN